MSQQHVEHSGNGVVNYAEFTSIIVRGQLISRTTNKLAAQSGGDGVHLGICSTLVTLIHTIDDSQRMWFHEQPAGSAAEGEYVCLCAPERLTGKPNHQPVIDELLIFGVAFVCQIEVSDSKFWKLILLLE